MSRDPGTIPQKVVFSIDSIEKNIEMNRCALNIISPKEFKMKLSIISLESIKISIPVKINKNETKDIPIVLMRKEYIDKLRDHITKQ